ncbi:MAG: Transcription elongation factor SPT5, partial [Paramarteilia canceri]
PESSVGTNGRDSNMPSSVSSTNIPSSASIMSSMVPVSPALSDTTSPYMSSVPSSAKSELVMTPFTAGIGETSSFSSNIHDWISVGLFVQVKENYSDQSFASKIGEVRSINGSNVSIYIDELKRTTTVNGSNLQPTYPELNDYAKIISGTLKDKTGQVISVKSDGFVLKISGDVQMCPLNSL